MRVSLDDIPLRDPSLTPAEILMSESQERMMAVVTPANVEAFLAVCAKWDVEATVIGEVTGDGMLTMTWRGGTVVSVPPETAADGPVYQRPLARPAGLDAAAGRRPGRAAPAGRRRRRCARRCWHCSARPTWPTRRWVTQQYDAIVRGNTVLAMPDDGGLIRVDEETGLGIALATDGNGRYCRLDPYAGTQLALGEACRNVAMTGARPMAVTNCLNFGSPEDPAVMWQLAEAVRGLADGCAELGIPVTGGNVSLYNQTGSVAIHPTPVIGVLGVHDDVRKRTGAGFASDGDLIYLLGATRDELGGSAWAHVVHGHLGGTPPAPDLAAERQLAELVIEATARGLLASAHDLSDGGLAIALAESCLRGGHGCRVSVTGQPGLPGDAFVALFSETPARAVVTVRPEGAEEVVALAARLGVPVTPIGSVTGDALDVTGLFAIPLGELSRTWRGTLPAIFG